VFLAENTICIPFNGFLMCASVPYIVMNLLHVFLPQTANYLRQKYEKKCKNTKASGKDNVPSAL